MSPRQVLNYVDPLAMCFATRLRSPRRSCHACAGYRQDVAMAPLQLPKAFREDEAGLKCAEADLDGTRR